MPELPEVETIVRDLKKELTGQKILKIEILDKKSARFLKKDFLKRVKGKIIKSVGRRAKLIIITLDEGQYLVFHLKITGQLILKEAAAAPDKFTRLVFCLSGRKKLLFNDLRKFGYLKLFNKEELKAELKRLNFGPEPLEKSFTLPVFESILKKRKKMPVKPLLMEQSLIAGIGNIYASEACFLAGIKPTRRAGRIKKEEVKKLYQAVIKVLKESIKCRGTSADDYLDAFGREGTYEEKLRVYGRKQEKCRRCPEKIIRIAQAGRGTFYCPACQK